MRNTFHFICLTVGLLFAALPAQAIDLKPYVGAGAGTIIVDAGLGSKTAFGGYGIVGADFTENVGAEVRFGSSGKTSGTVQVPAGRVGCDGTCGPGQGILLTAPTPASIGVDWFVAYLLKLQYPVSDVFRIYGVVGGTTLRSKFAFANPTNVVVRATNTTFSYGGGFDYGLNEQWRVGVDATVYANKATTAQQTNYSGLDVWGVTATARYGF